MNRLSSLDRIADRIRTSQHLSDNDKARLIRLCDKIRNLIERCKNIIHQIIALLHRHRELVQCTVLAVLLAAILRMIPILGEPLAFAIIMVGVAIGLVKELKHEVDLLLGFGTPVTA